MLYLTFISCKEKNIIPKKHVRCIALKNKQNTNFGSSKAKWAFFT